VATKTVTTNQMQTAYAKFEVKAHGGARKQGLDPDPCAVAWGDVAFGDVIPANSVIVGGFIRVLDPPAETQEVRPPSAYPTHIALSLEAPGDILPAAGINGKPWASAGVRPIRPTMTAEAVLVTTEDRQLTANLQVEPYKDLIGGAFEVYLWYYPLAVAA
jgi:hypothetical protein